MDELINAIIECMALVYGDDNEVFTVYWGTPEVGNYAISVRRPNDEEAVEHFDARPQDSTLH